ncbi:hypothetical protein LSAT2_002435 [Lamellibrachia satsuma]|nr:hypothetical protein LSAT2_002435 [Lamellibrachia satsuma]
MPDVAISARRRRSRHHSDLGCPEAAAIVHGTRMPARPLSGRRHGNPEAASACVIKLGRDKKERCDLPRNDTLLLLVTNSVIVLARRRRADVPRKTAGFAPAMKRAASTPSLRYRLIRRDKGTNEHRARGIRRTRQSPSFLKYHISKQKYRTRQSPSFLLYIGDGDNVVESPT